MYIPKGPDIRFSMQIEKRKRVTPCTSALSPTRHFKVKELIKADVNFEQLQLVIYYILFYILICS